jgi:hypothetical protein
VLFEYIKPLRGLVQEHQPLKVHQSPGLIYGLSPSLGIRHANLVRLSETILDLFRQVRIDQGVIHSESHLLLCGGDVQTEPQ